MATRTGWHSHGLAALILATALLVTWFAYKPGLGGSLHYDDSPSLGGLSTVYEPGGIFRFIASGSAGPSGRPIALASFVPQAYAWPDSPDVFLHTNVLIHLLNGILVTWFLYLLGRARSQGEKKAALVAAGAGALWMLMPLLASSSLFIVQRMTTLCALFMLLGAIGYLYARRRIEQRPGTSLCLMTLALVLGSLLAMLSKENGATLFLLILAMEATLLPRPSVPRNLWRTWFSVFLIAPLAVLVVYLGSVLPYSEELVQMRGFSGIDRLITEMGILWKYLYLAFLPHASGLGPYHDDYQIQRSLFNAVSMLSVAAWMVVVSSALLLRKKAPLYAFAVAWYLLGHLLESTTVSLELYFEHRNYLPLVGPVYALVASLAQLDAKWKKVAWAGAAVYAVMLGSVLFSTTSLWGTPALAAEVWHIYKPHSQRAVLNLGGQLERNGDSLSSRRLFARYLESNPTAHGIELRTLVLDCILEPDSDHRDALQALENHLSTTGFDPSIPGSLHQLRWLIRHDYCRSVNYPALYALGQALLNNPRFEVMGFSIHMTLAMASVDHGEVERGISHMEHALDINPNPDTLFKTIELLNAMGQFSDSRRLLKNVRDLRLPKHPLQAMQIKKELDRIEDFLIETEQSTTEVPTDGANGEK